MYRLTLKILRTTVLRRFLTDFNAHALACREYQIHSREKEILLESAPNLSQSFLAVFPEI
jgi:hypothetical protein